MLRNRVPGGAYTAATGKPKHRTGSEVQKPIRQRTAPRGETKTGRAVREARVVGKSLRGLQGRAALGEGRPTTRPRTAENWRKKRPWEHSAGRPNRGNWNPGSWTQHPNLSRSPTRRANRKSWAGAGAKKSWSGSELTWWPWGRTAPKKRKRRTAKTVQEKMTLYGRIETTTHAAQYGEQSSDLRTHRRREGLEKNSLNKTNPQI
jgi:hypothetical protein